MSDIPVTICPRCAGKGCKACDSFGHVMTQESREITRRFWENVPTVKIERMDQFKQLFPEDWSAL